MSNAMMKMKVIPGLKLKSKEELEEEARNREVQEEYLRKRSMLYSAESGIELSSDAKRRDEQNAKKRRAAAASKTGTDF